MAYKIYQQLELTIFILKWLINEYYMYIYIIILLQPRVFGTSFSFLNDGLLARRLIPNLEAQAICVRGFHPQPLTSQCLPAHSRCYFGLHRVFYFPGTWHIWWAFLFPPIGREWKIVVGRRRFTSGPRTVGEEEEDRNYHGGTRWRTLWRAEAWKRIWRRIDIFGK